MLYMLFFNHYYHAVLILFTFYIRIDYVATVSRRNPRWWFPTSQDSNHCCTRYSDRTRPEAYGATALTQNPRWWLTTSQDSNHTRNPSRARYSDRTRPDTYVATVPPRASRCVRCYSDRTRPETYVATVSRRNPRWWLSFIPRNFDING